MAPVDEMVDEIERGICSALDQTLRTTGAVHPPAVYMFTDTPYPSFIGSVVCRRFYPGQDAYRAVNRLGDVPAGVEATRLLVAFEAQDLNVALQLPVDPGGSALVVVDATLDGQVLRWYPLHLSRPRRRHPALVPEWGPVQTLTDPRLLEPLVRLLTVWRLARGANLDTAVRDVESEGYRITWYGR
ncbi:MAG: hypothetical protein GEV09_21700 [Pseudonocardiaceae bacterium]|nr:hypothetical protein [Pseudonocardiaceae bacterium]